MTNKETIKGYQIDAAGKALGRVATEAVKILRGKNSPTFVRNIAPVVEVKIINAAQMSLGIKKMKTKVYHHYSGYPGGMKAETLQKVIADKGSREVLRRAIYSMLPANKLRPIIMKNLIISE